MNHIQFNIVIFKYFFIKQIVIWVSYSEKYNFHVFESNVYCHGHDILFYCRCNFDKRVQM